MLWMEAFCIRIQAKAGSKNRVNGMVSKYSQGIRITAMSFLIPWLKNMRFDEKSVAEKTN